MTRSRYKIFSGDTAPYFVTATTLNWLPLFSNPEVVQIVFNSLKFQQDKGRITLFAYILMENHLHLVVSAPDLVKEMANFKSFTARESIDLYKAQGNKFILEQLSQHRTAYRKDRVYQFWQEGVHPKRIQDENMMRQKINYIHHNPVRRGYVDKATDWRYSSARNYAGMAGLLDVCMDW